MKKLLKFTLVLLAFLMAIVSVLAWSINPIIEQLRPQIVSAISSTIKQPVHIGAIKAKIFPTAGIEVRNVGPEGAAAQAANLDSLLFESSVTELLSGKISVSRLAIKGLHAEIVKLSDGTLSVGGITLGGSRAALAPAAPATTPAPAVADRAGPTLAFSVNDARIDNSHISFRDETVNPVQTIDLDQITLRFSAPDTVARGLNLSLKLEINNKEDVELKTQGSFDGQVLTLNSTALKLFGGTVNADGKISTAPDGRLQLAINGKGIDLGRVCDFVLTGKKSYCLKGTLESLNTSLNAGMQNVGATVQGPVTLRIGKGEISGVNLIGSALQKVQGIPGVAGSLAGLVPAGQQDVLQSSGTAFDSLEIAGALGNNSFALSQLDLRQALYQIQGSGLIGFAGSLNLKTELKLTPLIAGGMIKSQPNLKLLQDPQGNLSVPLQISKQGGAIVVLPDVEKLVKGAAAGAAKEAVSKGLQNLLSGKKGSGGENLLKKLF